tara:strand:+ start:699 stop:1007 length:309 start_codon:yes stop_codon:yes gene_type:complete
MKYLLAAASALLVASPALAHGPATAKRHYHSLGHHGHHAGTHKHFHCHKKKDVCHWHKHGHWGKDAGHHGKRFMHPVYWRDKYYHHNEHYWYPGPSWEIHVH